MSIVLGLDGNKHYRLFKGRLKLRCCFLKFEDCLLTLHYNYSYATDEKKISMLTN